MPVLAVNAQPFVDNFIDPFVDLFLLLAFLYFVFGILRFLYGINSGAKTEEIKLHLIWGTIGLFIALSANGIVGLLSI